jgi:hypothetical protein
MEVGIVPQPMPELQQEGAPKPTSAIAKPSRKTVVGLMDVDPQVVEQCERRAEARGSDRLVDLAEIKQNLRRLSAATGIVGRAPAATIKLTKRRRIPH